MSNLYFENEKKIIKKSIILPNFIYKENKIFWNFKKDVRINEGGKIKYIKHMELGNIPLHGDVRVFDQLIMCKINEISLSDGLSLEIEYEENEKINKRQLAKIAKLIEATLLDIDFYDDEYKDEKLFYEINDKIEYNNSINSNLLVQNNETDFDDDW